MQSYDEYYGFSKTPFVKNIPPGELFMSRDMENALGCMIHAASNQQMVALMGEPGAGKSTLIRKLDAVLSKDAYRLLYVADSGLTPKWLYNNYLEQLGMQREYFRGPARHSFLQEMESLAEKKISVVCVLDEAHLLERETLEEFRFFLNSGFDSKSPVSLILVGQTELWTHKLRLKEYQAIQQRLDWRIFLKPLDRTDTERYLNKQMEYGGRPSQNIFDEKAIDIIFQSSSGIPRLINRICDNALLYGAQQGKKKLDSFDLRYVMDHMSLQAPS